MARLVLPAILALAASIVCVVSPASAAESVRIVRDRLPVRRGPGTRYRILGRAPEGNRYTVVARQPKWIQIGLAEGKRGWVNAAYVRAAEGRTEYCQASDVNVRSGAGTRFRVLGRLSRNQRVTVLEGNPNWKRIRYRGREAFVARRYLSLKVAPEPPPRRRSSAGFVQLRASGPGFVSYASPSARWGVPKLVYGLERAAYRWKQTRERARVRIGDISRENGGALAGHASHRTGKDVDVAPLRRDNAEAPITRFSSLYSRAKTRKYLNFLRAEVRPSLVLFNDSGVGGVTSWPNHDNHFHYRVP